MIHSFRLTRPRDPEFVSKAYTEDCIWRNRQWFFTGTEAIIDFLKWKWNKEHNYKLRKELFAFTDNKIAVQFWYEYQDGHDGMKWKRCKFIFASESSVRYFDSCDRDLALHDPDQS